MVLVACAVSWSSCRTVFPRQYEYEEELYLALDGSATLYVNGSIPALVALRGIDHDLRPTARLDRAAIRRAYTSPVTTVTRLSSSRRAGRRFAHLRIAVSDVRRLSEAAPFAWSRYELRDSGGEVVFSQVMGDSARRSVGDVGWTGAEMVAVRLHLPSKIRYHDAPSKSVERGNIVSWEQPLSERLKGTPLHVEVRLDPQTILYRTLWLFAITIGLAALTFGAVIWWLLRAGRRHEATP